MSNYGGGSYGSGYGGEEENRHGHHRHEGRLDQVGNEDQQGSGYGSRPEVRYGDQGAYGSHPQGTYGHGSRPEVEESPGYGTYGRPSKIEESTYGRPPAEGTYGYGSRPQVEETGYGTYGHTPKIEESAYGRPPAEGAYGHRPQGQSYEHGRPQKNTSQEAEGQAMKVFCEANPDYCLTVREDRAILAPFDGSQHQIFFKDCKWGSKVQDESGSPAFAIVNKSLGMALKHRGGINEKVTLGPYDGETLDESFLWTQSGDVGDGFQCLRPVGNVKLNLDALHGDRTIRTGTELILFKWNKQQNQKWKIVPASGGYSRGDY